MVTIKTIIKFHLSPVILFSCISILYSQTWQNIGPGGGSDLHFAAIHPTNSDIIYVGGDIEGIFKSTNGGESWENINNNLAHSNLGAGVYWTNDIVFDPANYNHIYYCTEVGLFKSENAGEVWEQIYPAEYTFEDEAIPVSALAIDPSDNNTMFIGLGDAADGSFADFQPFPDFEGPTGLFKTTDGGGTWIKLNPGMPSGTNIHSILISPIDSEQIIFSSTRGIFKSSDGGDSWEKSVNGLPHENIHRLQGRVFENGYHIFTSLKTLGNSSDSDSFSGGLFKSTNFGDNWQDITGNLPRYSEEADLFYDYWKFDIYPNDIERIVTVTTRGSSWIDSGIYETKDGGINWEHVYYPVIGGWMEGFFFDPYGFEIKISPSDPTCWILLLDDVEISNDDGKSWENAFTTKIDDGWQGNGLELMNTETIAFHSSNPDVFWVGYDDMGLFRSDDGGNSFIQLDPAMDPTIGNLSDVDAVKDIEIDPLNNDLYISRFQGSQGGYNANFTSGGIVFSNDLGETQLERSTNLPSGRCDLVLDKVSGEPGSRTLYTAVYHHSVFKSTNSGNDWFEVSDGLDANAELVWTIEVDPYNSEILYLGLNSRGQNIQGLYESTNGGSSWKLVPNFPAGDVLAIYINKLGIYASLTDNFDWNYSGGLYFSSDKGETWTKILDHSRVTVISSHPDDDKTLIAAGQQWYITGGDKPALFYSTDNGLSWDEISNGMDHMFINAAAFNPHQPVDIYACTAGGGLWRYTDTNTDVTKNSLPMKNFLHHNYPNPFNPTTTISFSIAKQSTVKLVVYNILGEEIKMLVNRNVSSGTHHIKFDGSSLPSGVYFYKLVVDDFTDVKKLILLK